MSDFEKALFEAAHKFNEEEWNNQEDTVHKVNFKIGARWAHERDLKTIERLREALEFYANPSNWFDSDQNIGQEFLEIDEDDSIYCPDTGDQHGGKRAKEALAKEEK